MIARPLHLLTMKNQRLKWGPEEEKAFRGLQDRLASAPMLDYPVSLSAVAKPADSTCPEPADGVLNLLRSVWVHEQLLDDSLAALRS